MNVTEAKAKIREITNTTTSDYSDASLIRDLNEEMRAIKTNIQRDRGVLEFDDVNYTDIPVATLTLVSGQTAYKIVEDENSHLITTVHKVAIDVGNGYTDVPRKTVGEGSQEPLIDSSEAAIPRNYYEVGKSVIFSQTPSQAGTIQVWFDRDIDIILVGDTSKVPGIPADYHSLLCYRTAYNYALDKGLANGDRILRRTQTEEARMEQYEENRRADESVTITVDVIRGL